VKIQGGNFMLNRTKWTAVMLGATLMVSGGVATMMSQQAEVPQMSIEGLKTQESVRNLNEESSEWSEMLQDFKIVMDLDQNGDTEDAIEKWEELIPEVDVILGIKPGSEETFNIEDLEGWSGYINSFSELIEDQAALEEMMDYAEDIDSLSSDEARLNELEAQIALLLKNALSDIDLSETESMFYEPEDLADILTEDEAEQYGNLLDEYNADEASNDFEGAKDSYDQIIDLLNNYPEIFEQGEGELFAQFDVNGNQLNIVENPLDEDGNPMDIEAASQADISKYKLLWNYVTKLMPKEASNYVDKFEVGTDGRDGTMAFVYSTDESAKKFVLNLDIKDMTDADGQYRKKDMDETIVHEFGHILTLNNTQFSENAKDTYHTQEGILSKGSYLNKFHGAFWNSEMEKYLLSNNDGMREYDVDELFGDHESWFVSDYAATNTEEDIAESFRVFVLEDKASGNDVKDQKVNFFYQFPELVKMRDEIRASAK